MTPELNCKFCDLPAVAYMSTRCGGTLWDHIILENWDDDQFLLLCENHVASQRNHFKHMKLPFRYFE